VTLPFPGGSGELAVKFETPRASMQLASASSWGLRLLHHRALIRSGGLETPWVGHLRAASWAAACTLAAEGSPAYAPPMRSGAGAAIDPSAGRADGRLGVGNGRSCDSFPSDGSGQRPNGEKTPQFAAHDERYPRASRAVRRYRASSHASSIARVNRMCRPIRRHGNCPVRTAS
jgi:hypothetical protein